MLDDLISGAAHELRDSDHNRTHNNNVTFAQLDAIEAKSKANDANTYIAFLKQKVEKLMIITEAMWLLLKETTKCSDEDLKEKIRQVDMKDGKLDGKVAAELPNKCPKCGQTLQKNMLSCIYCGAQTDKEVFSR
jgi:ribosomal protein L32